MNKPAARPSNSAPSIIGSDVTIKGDITTAGEIQLDGTVEGDVRSTSLTIGEHGSVKGIVTAEDVVIKGSVTGQVNSRNIRLEKMAKVKGDLFHETLSVEAGAFIEGKLTHKSNVSQAKEESAKLSPTANSHQKPA
ncbi:MAG: polymer-forming cytoskeletal protein [Emcibacter sp.]|nr:polymer-forming cytoskeletal protein [Emcibacter sp.]